MPKTTLRDALLKGRRYLEDSQVPEPRLTAEVLLSHVLGTDREYLYTHPERVLNSLEQLHYARYLNERSRGKPTQQITRRQEFYGREFLVTPAVLIPRPETELLVEETLRHLRPGCTAADIGCGSGAIGVTLALETQGTCRIVMSDISSAALAVAHENARRLGARALFFQGDFAAAIGRESLDVLVSNPPYIPRGEFASLQREVRDWEPVEALIGGENGLEPYQTLVTQARTVLRPGGWILFEIGYRAAEALRELFEPPWSEFQIQLDLAGWPRVAAARWTP